MNWLFLALIAPVLWAAVNHIDKYLLSHHFKGRSIGSLMVFSTLIGVLVLPVAYVIQPTIWNISAVQIAILVAVGILSAVAVWLYLIALEDDEASIVVPLFQTIPLFGAMFAFLFLGETLTRMQGLGCLSIMLGSMVLTLEVNEERRVRLKKKVLLCMLGSAAIFGLYEALFKFAAIGGDFWVATFWEHAGLLLFGVILLLIPRFRKDFRAMVALNGKSIFALNIGSEIMTIVGNIITNYALLLAPVALVLVVSGTHPFWVLSMGLLLTAFFPHLGKEKMTKKHVVHKFTAILIMFVGVLMLH
jgi:transporter family protein